MIVYCEIQSMFTINISEEYIPDPIKPNNDTKPENTGLSSIFKYYRLDCWISNFRSDNYSWFDFLFH